MKEDGFPGILQTPDQGAQVCGLGRADGEVIGGDEDAFEVGGFGQALDGCSQFQIRVLILQAGRPAGEESEGLARWELKVDPFSFISGQEVTEAKKEGFQQEG